MQDEKDSSDAQQEQQQQQTTQNSGTILPDPNPQQLDRAETPRDLEKRHK